MSYDANSEMAEMFISEKRGRYLLRLLFVLFLISISFDKGCCVRVLGTTKYRSDGDPKSAVFALGSFWWADAVFGCVNGVVRTTAGYAGGSKTDPEYRNLGDHAESVQVEYDASMVSFNQLLDVFWSNHDSRQVFGQGPDVGSQYRSIIFTNGSEEFRLATLSKEREQLKSKTSVVTTQIQLLGKFYPAEPEHQKFELKRNPFLVQLMGNVAEEELERSSLAAKLNGYAAELCPPRTRKQINSKISDIIKQGWPLLREVNLI